MECMKYTTQLGGEIWKLFTYGCQFRMETEVLLYVDVERVVILLAEMQK